MDKLNLMKAVLTLYISAVVVIFFFHPTAKDYFPATVENGQACFLSQTLNEMDPTQLTQFFVVGNTRFPLKALNERCFSFSSEVPGEGQVDGKILIVRKGRSLWSALTKKVKGP